MGFEQQRDGPLPVRSFNHASRVCHDVEASVRFYRHILGFIRIQRPSSFDFDGAWLFHPQCHIGMHLIRGTPEPRSATINPQADHLSFQSDSLEVVEERLKGMGIEYDKEHVVENGIRVTQVFFHDPDRNMIEICNCDCLPIRPMRSLSHSLSRSLSHPLQLQQGLVCPATPPVAEAVRAAAPPSAFSNRQPLCAESAA
jgi:catechol 2,3-dioxygenase-like lactoylglutathione lyase family enzyme